MSKWWPHSYKDVYIPEVKQQSGRAWISLYELAVPETKDLGPVFSTFEDAYQRLLKASGRSYNELSGRVIRAMQPPEGRYRAIEVLFYKEIL